MLWLVLRQQWKRLRHPRVSGFISAHANMGCGQSNIGIINPRKWRSRAQSVHSGSEAGSEDESEDCAASNGRRGVGVGIGGGGGGYTPAGTLDTNVALGSGSETTLSGDEDPAASRLRIAPGAGPDPGPGAGTGQLLAHTEISASQLDFFQMLDHKIDNGPDYDPDSEFERIREQNRIKDLLREWEASRHRSAASTPPTPQRRTDFPGPGDVYSKDHGLRQLPGARPGAVAVPGRTYPMRPGPGPGPAPGPGTVVQYPSPVSVSVSAPAPAPAPPPLHDPGAARWKAKLSWVPEQRAVFSGRPSWYQSGGQAPHYVYQNEGMGVSYYQMLMDPQRPMALAAQAPAGPGPGAGVQAPQPFRPYSSRPAATGMDYVVDRSSCEMEPSSSTYGVQSSSSSRMSNHRDRLEYDDPSVSAPVSSQDLYFQQFQHNMRLGRVPYPDPHMANSMVQLDKSGGTRTELA